MNPRAIALVVALGMLIPACGDDDPTEPGDTPAFTLTVAPTTLPIVAGSAAAAVQAVSARGQATLNITVARSGGFEGSVTVAVEGLPTGVTATSLTIQASQTTGVVTLTAAATAAAGTTQITVRGTGTGVDAKTQTVSLVVSTPPPPDETFAIEFGTETGSVVQGGTITVDLTIDRSGGYSGTVTLTAESAPDGLELTFNPTATQDDEATLTITAGAALTPQVYTVTATGTGGDHESQATVAITVTASGGGSGNTSIQFCEQSGLPEWVAFQDGSGPWIQAIESDSEPGLYSFDIDSGRGGVAAVIVDNGEAGLVLYYGSQQELDLFGQGQCVEDGTTKTLTGSFLGVAAGDAATVTVDGSTATYFGGVGNPNFTLEDVAEGPTDLLANLTVFEDDGQGDIELVAEKAIIRRNVNYPAGSAIPVIDFDNEGFVPVRRDVTVTNELGQSLILTSAFTTPRATGMEIFTDLFGGTHYFGVPESEREDGDLHVVTVLAVDDGQTEPFVTRSAASYFGVAEDVTIDLGPLLSNVAVTVEATAPYVRPRATFDIVSEYDRFWLAGFAADNGNAATILMFEGYAPGATFDQTLPDFSPISGWDNAWGPQGEIFYTLSASGWDSDGDPGSPPQVEGGTSRSAGEGGTIN